MQERDWVRCLVCSEEWTKLRPCLYKDDEGHDVVTDLCVVCSETLAAWPWLMKYAPLEGLYDWDLKWRKPRYVKVNGIEGDQPSNAYLILQMGDAKIVATSNGTGFPIRFKAENSKNEHIADNIFVLRSKLKYGKYD